MPTQVNQFVRFGPFEVNVRTEELRRNGQKVKLQSQPIRILSILIEKPGELVTREDLQRRIWPEDTFVDFEHSLNTAVKKLRQALEDDAENPVYIETLPKRGYRFIGMVRNEPAQAIEASGRADSGEGSPQPEAPKRGRRSRWRYLAIVAGTLLATIAVLWLVRAASTPAEQAPRLLVTIPGCVCAPAFSPDGARVAFVLCQQTEKEVGDIYVKSLPDGSLLKVTSTPGKYFCPRFSPDGKYLGFVKFGADQPGVYVIPALGGSVGKLLTLHPWDFWFDWSPDGKSVVYPDSDSPNDRGVLHRLDLQTLQDSTIATGNLAAPQPLYSPDGQWIAFGSGWDQLAVIPSAGGKPRTLTDSSADGSVGGFAWTPDSKEIVYSSQRSGQVALWRRSIKGGRPQLVLPGTAPNFVLMPAISPKGNRLVYMNGSGEEQAIFRLELPTRSNPHPGPPRKLISSTEAEQLGQISPDAKKIVFQSTRSGASEIWSAESDGSNQLQLTHFGSGLTGTPRWSPDGKWISFGHDGVYVMSANGASSHKIGTCAGISSWSHDGKWIYCNGLPDRNQQIWKVSLQSGETRQITQNGGFNAFESRNGEYVYFTKWETGGVFRVPAVGGGEVKVIDYPPAGAWGFWVLTDDGIYFIAPNEDSTSDVRYWLEFFDFASSTSSRVAPIKHVLDLTSPGFSVSPDRTWMVYSGIDAPSQTRIMMLENFR